MTKLPAFICAWIGLLSLTLSAWLSSPYTLQDSYRYAHMVIDLGERTLETMVRAQHSKNRV